jgi:tetratricopeptide (TPR) repeat protein
MWRLKKYLMTVFVLTVFLFPSKVFAESAEQHFRKGHRFYLDSKPTEAEAEFRKALRLNPKLSNAYYYLGSIYFKQNRYNEAKKECEQALKINPEDLKSLIILGLSFQQLGLIDQAISIFQKAGQFDAESAAVHSALGLAYCAKRDLAKAKEAYNTLKQIDSKLAGDLLQRIREIE